MIRHGLSGYILLTVLAFLAPTPLPIPLDGVVIALIKLGFSAKVVVALTIIANLIGTFIVFKLGNKSRDLLVKHKAKRRKKINIIADDLFKKYGKFALLLSGIPFLGDALIFISGFYKIHMGDFFLYFILGKVLWYSLLVLGIRII